MTQVQFTIRTATIADTPAIFSLIVALANYENLSDKVTGNIESLQEDFFGAKPCIEAIVAEIEPNQQIVGFALLGLTQCRKRGKKEEELGKAKWQRNLAS